MRPEGAALALLLSLAACDRGGATPATAAPAASASAADSAGLSARGRSPLHEAGEGPGVRAAPSASAAGEARTEALSDRELGALITSISEAGGKFPSDNFVSNETSYLHVVGELAPHRGGAYVGVGPEQNFTYLALLEPALAFVIDIRRENLLLHLVYKVLFEREATRAGFVAGLTSRPAPAVAADAPVEAIMEAVQKAAPDPALSASLLAAVEQRARALGVPLSAEDGRNIREALDAFRQQGPGIHYTMAGSARRYPSFGELMAARDDRQHPGSFLGTPAAYERVRRMQRDNRVVPLVGDLGGDGALTRLGAELKRRSLPVQVFYTSNVEQYLFEPKPWAAWVRNLDGLPWAPDGVIVRVYFDQGKTHPLQKPGHRTTSMVRPAAAFLERAHRGGWKSWWDAAQ